MKGVGNAKFVPVCFDKSKYVAKIYPQFSMYDSGKDQLQRGCIREIASHSIIRIEKLIVRERAK